MTPEWLTYANQGATRNQPLDPRLVAAMGFLPEMGLAMEVFSGGQPGIGTGGARVGSTRHDHGNAADVFFSQNGQRIDWANPAHLPLFEEIVRRGKAAGVTGFGAGPGYMQPGSMHLGFGAPGVWGAGGKAANAPDWLVSAFGGGAPGPMPTGSAPGVATAFVDQYGSAGAPPGMGQTPLSFGPIGQGPAAPALGQIASNWFNQQQARQTARAEEDRARRQALFGGPPGGGLGALYG